MYLSLWPFGLKPATTSRLFRVSFSFAGCAHRMAPVACRPVIKCGKIGALVRARFLSFNMSIKRGRSQPRAGIVERPFLAAMSLSPTSCRARRSEKRKVAVKRPLLQHLAAPVGLGIFRVPCGHFLGLLGIPGHFLGLKILTSTPEEQRALIYGAAKRQLLPLQCRIETQKIYLEQISKDIEKKQQTRLDILQKWIEADQALESANAKQFQAIQAIAALVAEQAAENANAVNQEFPGAQPQTTGSVSDMAAQQTVFSSDAKQRLQQCIGAVHGV